MLVLRLQHFFSKIYILLAISNCFTKMTVKFGLNNIFDRNISMKRARILGKKIDSLL